MNLYILDVCIKGTWQEAKVFEPDPNQDPNEQNEKTTLLDQAEQFHKDQGHHTGVKWIHGIGVEALRKYFKEHL